MAEVPPGDMKESIVPPLFRGIWCESVLQLGERTQFTKEGWKQSVLVLACLRSSLRTQSQDQVGKPKHGSRSLSEVAILDIIHTFVHLGEIEGDAKVILSPDSLILGCVLEEELLPYKLLRMVLNYSSSRSGGLDSSNTIVDIGEAIL